VTSPSRLGSAFLVLFGLPFLGAGLLFAFKFLASPDQTPVQKIGAVSFGSVFAIIGGGLIYGALFGYSRQKEQIERQQANPSSPWLWRKDWAASRVESKNKSKVIAWWVGAVLVNMLSLPFSLSATAQLSRGFDPKYVVPAAFELIGLLLVFGAIRATVRLERFGNAYFEMSSLPYSPGGRVVGAIHVQLRSDMPHGVDLKLSCVRRITTGSGDNRSTQRVPLWEDSKNISAAALSRGPLDTVIPVDFTVPADAFQTDTENSSDQVAWVLDARADVPGVDYTDQFELPVFRTAQSLAVSPVMATNAPSAHFGRVTTTTAGEIDQEVGEPAQHRALVNELPDGLEFYFRAGRNVARAALVLVLAAGCSAFLCAMLQTARRPPMFAFVVVGLLAFFLTIASVHSAFSSVRIVAGNGMISWRRSVFGIGSSRQVQVSEVESITAATSIQQAGSSGNTLYSIRLKTKDGKSRTLIDEIESRQEARWIVSQIEKRAGLALNTQVEISNSLYGPPPQAASSSQFDYGSAGGLRTSTRSSGNWSQAVGAVFFIGWLAFVGFMMFRTTRTRSARSRALSAATASGAQFVRAPRMKQATLQEISSWAPQQQAEELLARSVEHDRASVDALDQSSTQWVSMIHGTANLDQLENAARYSSDLRVRRAEADLELAADGWQKSAAAVDLLIGGAQSDPAARASAVYLLGILAGDGIEAERAHKSVLAYARNDGSAAVRQWATEGLRFVGTDQALDDLFDIFTHDASFAVRDRAGCNISDCGIFERKQRLRMVPHLVDLVSDPRSNAQMRNWSFLALREITDENLPPDAIVWRHWYQEKGPSKQAQFAALDWWQVRGDN
jgi:hypothetical protein